MQSIETKEDFIWMFHMAQKRLWLSITLSQSFGKVYGCNFSFRKFCYLRLVRFFKFKISWWPCYWVQAHSISYMIGQWILEMRCGGKEYNFLQKAGWRRRGQTNVSEQPSLGLVLLWIWDEGKWGNKIKRPFNLESTSLNGRPQVGGYVNSFLPAIYKWIRFGTKAL